MMNNGATDIGICPECGSTDCECWHETIECAIEVLKDNGIDFINDKLTWEEA